MSIKDLWLRAPKFSTTRAGTFVLAVLVAAQSAAAADKLIAVDWSDPEISRFTGAQASAPRSLGPEADDKLGKLRLPVLAFEATPGVVAQTLNIGPRPAVERDVVMDEAEPVWYQLVERYGDVTVSVSADLRIQHAFPAGAIEFHEPEGQGAAPVAGPTVSVFDDSAYGGEEGYLAEYTITKFGVPYTVTVECSEAAKEQCRDTAQISKDSELLGLIRATPPAEE